MIKHLKESTDTVESRKKFTKLILKLCYWGLWVLSIVIYWIICFSNFKYIVPPLSQPPYIYNFLAEFVIEGQMFFIPAAIAVIMGFTGAAKDFNRRRWLYVPITGAMFILYRILTEELVTYIVEVYVMREIMGEELSFNILKPFIHYFTHVGFSLVSGTAAGEWILILLLGFGCSALGLVVGILIRNFKIVRREQQAE